MSTPEDRDRNDDVSEKDQSAEEPENEYDEVTELAPQAVPVDGPAPLP